MSRSSSDRPDVAGEVKWRPQRWVENTMTEKERTTISERLQHLGYRRNKHIKLYGEKYLITSEPIVVDDHVAWVDAIDRKSGLAKRIAIPLPVLDVASEKFG